MILPRSVGFAGVGFLVPSAVRVTDASKAVIVAAVAHDDVHLADAMIRRGVNGFMLQ